VRTSAPVLGSHRRHVRPPMLLQHDPAALAAGVLAPAPVEGLRRCGQLATHCGHRPSAMVLIISAYGDTLNRTYVRRLCQYLTSPNHPARDLRRPVRGLLKSLTHHIRGPLVAEIRGTCSSERDRLGGVQAAIATRRPSSTAALFIAPSLHEMRGCRVSTSLI
jgi:hypothetical protein